MGPLSAKEIRQWEELKQREERARRGHRKRKPYQRHHLDKRAGQLLAEGDPREGDDDLLETREVADWIGVSYEWLCIGRHRGFGPPFIKVSSRRVRYRRGDVRDWLRSRTFTSTDQYGPNGEVP